MQNRAPEFIARSAAALDDVQLQTALGRARPGFINKRRKAVEAAGNFDALREAATEAKTFALDHLAQCAERFEQQVQAHGGQVHWAEQGADLNRIVLDIAKRYNARRVTKGKSMIAEETGLNAALEAHGITPTETDLGEYIIQLAQEPPSHIIAPAVHKTRQQVAQLFRAHHALGPRELGAIADLVEEARCVLRQRFLEADIGITGANLLVAENGAAIVVTNEGNGDLSAGLPRVHIVTASIDKLVASQADANAVLRVLGRSGTGQAMTAYTSSFFGPRQQSQPDGPDEFHIILLDNGRSEILSSEFRDILRCIRCGACLNHCPIYTRVGGHAYGWVYPGPMGSVLTPLLTSLGDSHDLPHASSFCGHCEQVCPVSIPLPELLRRQRFRDVESGQARPGWRRLLRLHGWLIRRPRLYRLVAASGLRIVRVLHRTVLARLLPGWFAVRELPDIETGTGFVSRWQQGHRH